MQLKILLIKAFNELVDTASKKFKMDLVPNWNLFSQKEKEI